MAGKCFLERVPDDSAYINFIKIAVSLTTSTMNAFRRFTQEFKIATKYGWQKVSDNCIWPGSPKFPPKLSIAHHFRQIAVKWFLTKSGRWICVYLQDKNFVEIAQSCIVFELNAFFEFYLEIQGGHQKWWGKRFLTSARWLFLYNGVKNGGGKWFLTKPFPRLMRFCALHRNSRWPPKVVGKQFWVKSRQIQKFCQNCTILHHFPT